MPVRVWRAEQITVRVQFQQKYHFGPSLTPWLHLMFAMKVGAKIAAYKVRNAPTVELGQTCTFKSTTAMLRFLPRPPQQGAEKVCLCTLCQLVANHCACLISETLALCSRTFGKPCPSSLPTPANCWNGPGHPTGGPTPSPKEAPRECTGSPSRRRP